MKIFHTICAAFMAATIASCDAHQDFPDTSMKIGDILCTDGKVVRYEKMKAQEKTPIAVVFYVNQKEDIEGTGYAVYLKDIEPCAYSDSIGIKHDTSADLAAFVGTAIPMPCILPILRLQPKLFLTCGNMDRAPTSLPLLSYTCCMK